MNRLLVLLLLLIAPLCQAQVAYNGDIDWGTADPTDVPPPYESSLLTVDANFGSTDNYALVVGIGTYNANVGDLNFVCRWGGSAGTVMTMQEWEGGSSIQRVYLYTLHDVDTTESNSETVYCTGDGGTFWDTGLNFFAMTFSNVDSSTPVNVCAGTCTESSQQWDTTITIPASNFNGDSGDMIVGIGDQYGSAIGTCAINGQTASGPVVYNNSSTCAMWKSWDGPQGNSLQFGDGDVAFPSMAGIVLKAGTGETGPSVSILRRRGR